MIDTRKRNLEYYEKILFSLGMFFDVFNENFENLGKNNQNNLDYETTLNVFFRIF